MEYEEYKKLLDEGIIPQEREYGFVRKDSLDLGHNTTNKFKEIVRLYPGLMMGIVNFTLVRIRGKIDFDKRKERDCHDEEKEDFVNNYKI